MLTPKQKRNVRKWIKALRSGEYAQTTGVLKDDAGYCCLGVMCDIINAKGWGPPPAAEGERGYTHRDGRISVGVAPDYGNSFPDTKWMEEHFGLPELEAGELAIMNDDGSDFMEIADEIAAITGVRA